MTIEEKARAYDEAKSIMEKYLKSGNAGVIAENTIKKAFPEIEENEDERIRKEIIRVFKGEISFTSEKANEKYIAWLEKQGEKLNEWKEGEEEKIRKVIIKMIADIGGGYPFEKYGILKKEALAWLEKLGRQKPTMVQWTGDNLKELVQFTGKSPKFDEWFRTWEDFENYVHTHNNIFKIFNKDGSHIEIPVGAWIIKTPDGYNVPSKGIFKQKPADKVEPKFKIEKGKWYVCNISRYTDFVVGKAYYCPKNGMLKPNENEMARYVAKDCFHLWTIDDAKDGDVLATENFIFIFKNIDNDNGVHYYCHYEISKHEEDNQFDVARPQSLMGRVGNSISHYSPATKEQRDLLLKAITDAGYVFDAEKKVLKKVVDISYCKEYCKGYKEKGGICYFGFDCPSIKEAEQKPVHQEESKVSSQESSEWSKEDEVMLDAIISNYEFMSERWLCEHKKELGAPSDGARKDNAEEIDWLKSLKERVQSRPKQEWSDEDGKMLNSFLHKAEVCDLLTNKEYRWIVKNLKSLIPQKQWKPTQEQMKCLAAAVEEVGGNFVLDSLYEQLKQLYYDTSTTN